MEPQTSICSNQPIVLGVCLLGSAFLGKSPLCLSMLCCHRLNKVMLLEALSRCLAGSPTGILRHSSLANALSYPKSLPLMARLAGSRLSLPLATTKQLVFFGSLWLSAALGPQTRTRCSSVVHTSCAIKSSRVPVRTFSSKTSMLNISVFIVIEVRASGTGAVLVVSDGIVAPYIRMY